ncbi:hypothetical protein ABH922_005646 [Rhodococcus sp. 27YEA15]|uniref:hypothetical protein n=1 Tax=Rhodococcus sp. 27YEA15 TaxID=3156259 RepID=UPI003C7C5FB0
MRNNDRSLSSLPGVRRFYAQVDRAVDDGRSVLIVVPDSSVELGLAEQLRDGLVGSGCVHQSLDVEILRDHNDSIPDAVAAAVNFLEPLQNDDRVNRWQAYLHHDDARSKSVLVAAWDVDLSNDVRYWLRLVHGSSMDPYDRPTFVFLVRESDVDIELLEKEHAPHLAVLWWWGVVGLLDSELCVDLELADQEVTPLCRAMLSETIGWEIDLVPDCARTWGSSNVPSILAKTILEHAEGRTFSLDDKEVYALDHASLADRPAHELRNAWNEGKVNAWNGRIHVSSRYDKFDRVVDRRFWNAQARILMPQFEHRRQILAKRFEKLATASEIANTLKHSDFLELGPMLNAHTWGRVDFGREDGALLRTLVDARNKIAHHTSLGDDVYAEITKIYQ